MHNFNIIVTKFEEKNYYLKIFRRWAGTMGEKEKGSSNIRIFCFE